MPRSSTDTRERILQAAYELFYAKGFARVGVDAVAEQAGLTKRTLYYHFKSKDDLLAAVLEHRGELALERIRRWAAGLKGDAEAFVEALFRELSRWASRPGWEGAGFTRVVMELADLPGHPARAIARRHKAAVEAWLAQELATRKVRQSALAAREVTLLLEGCVALMLIHGSADYAAAAAGAARCLVSLR
ncbi:MAG: TetR/AcrR family transcriptional regulator [Microvirga sp.]